MGGEGGGGGVGKGPMGIIENVMFPFLSESMITTSQYLLAIHSSGCSANTLFLYQSVVLYIVILR